MTRERPTHAELRKWDNAHVWHPFAPMSVYRAEGPPIITDAEGFFLIDAAGNRYLDGVSSLWCNVHGHRVPEIDAAIRAQLDRVAHSTLLGLGGEAPIQLAHELARRAPEGLTKVFYSDSGATAVEAALKMAFQYHRQRRDGSRTRDTFLAIGEAYHGDTVGAVSVGGVELFHAAYRPLLFPTMRVPAPVRRLAPPGIDADAHIASCLEQLERALAQHADRIAAVVIEPIVQGASGILVHEPGYLRLTRELTRRHDTLLIADEVAVGFGKTGALFACELENVAPDFLCLAKGLTGGYLPVAATLTTECIFDAFLGEVSERRTFYHGHTYTGNPLGCAAGLASLELFDTRRVLDNVALIANHMAERLAVLKRHPHVAEVRQKGVMIGIELVMDRDGDRPYPFTEGRGRQVTLAARKKGVIIRPLGDVVVLMPACAMPLELVDNLIDVALESIDDVTRP